MLLTDVVEQSMARNAELLAANQATIGARLVEQANAAFVLSPGVEDPQLLDRAVTSTVPFCYWRDDHLQIELRNSMEIAEMGHGCGVERADGEPCQTMSALVVIEQVVRFTVDRKGRIV